jgi:hypothetical protein
LDKNVLTTYDSIDNHLKLAGEFDRAAVPMGMYIAWALNLGLIKSEVVAQHEQLVMRVRMQDAKGSELLMSVGGDLDAGLFTDRGQRFAASYYPRYMADYRSIFGEDLYDVEDSWGNYDKIARVLTQELLGSANLTRQLVRRVKSGSTSFVNFWKSIWRSE